MNIMWSQEEAVELASLVESVISDTCGCHVALTGGCLYKTGLRKDCDLLFYRVRQSTKIDKPKLFAVLKEIGLLEERGFGWCHKAIYKGKQVDLFFPEDDGGEYANGEITAAPTSMDDFKAFLKGLI